MRSVIRIGPIIGLIGLLAGCGSSQPGRTEGAMATGAATGGAIGLIGGPIGVVIGAAAGAGAGALTAVNTTPKQVNLPSPPWGGSGGNEPVGSQYGGSQSQMPDYPTPAAAPPAGVQTGPVPLEPPGAVTATPVAPLQ